MICTSYTGTSHFSALRGVLHSADTMFFINWRFAATLSWASLLLIFSQWHLLTLSHILVILATFQNLYYFKKNVLEYNWLTKLCWFQVYSKVNLLHIYIYPLFFRFFSHVGHYRVLNSFLCYIACSYVYVNPNLPIYPSPSHPLVTIRLFKWLSGICTM